MKFYNHFFLFNVGIIFIVTGFLLSCDKNPTSSNNTPEADWQLTASVFPNMGTITTRFQPNVMLINAEDTSEV